MKVSTTTIPGLLLIEPVVRSDERGLFRESWHAERYAAAGIRAAFVQENQSRSAPGVLRGLHYQVEQPQGKLVEVAAGAVFDVAVDLRRTSPTFGRWVGTELSDANHHQLWIPPGWAHGFYVTRGPASLLYRCTAYYAPQHERVLRWDDPDLAISWPLCDSRSPVVSAKDAAGLPFRSAPTFE